MEIKIRYAEESDLPEIINILNESILTRSIVAITELIKPVDRVDWFSGHSKNTYPLLVSEVEDEIVGWASISPYRKGRDALKRTVEVSYYLYKKFQRKGIGDSLLKEILRISKELGYLTVIAILFHTNVASIKLLEKNGFEKWGFLPDVIDISGINFSHLYYGKKL